MEVMHGVTIDTSHGNGCQSLVSWKCCGDSERVGSYFGSRKAVAVYMSASIRKCSPKHSADEAWKLAVQVAKRVFPDE